MVIFFSPPFPQDSSLLVHSLENVSLNARNENGDVTGRITVGERTHVHADTCGAQTSQLMYESDSEDTGALQGFLIQH